MWQRVSGTHQRMAELQCQGGVGVEWAVVKTEPSPSKMGQSPPSFSRWGPALRGARVEAIVTVSQWEGIQLVHPAPSPPIFWLRKRRLKETE